MKALAGKDNYHYIQVNSLEDIKTIARRFDNPEELHEHLKERRDIPEHVSLEFKEKYFDRAKCSRKKAIELLFKDANSIKGA